MKYFERMNDTNLIPFDISRALAGDALRTRDGKRVTDFHEGSPEKWRSEFRYWAGGVSYTRDGRYGDFDSSNDLFMVHAEEPDADPAPMGASWMGERVPEKIGTPKIQSISPDTRALMAAQIMSRLGDMDSSRAIKLAVEDTDYLIAALGYAPF